MARTLSFEKLLTAFFVFIGAMICCRIFYSGSGLFLFLLWNIFLAWVPFRISHYLAKQHNRGKWKKAILFAAWLLFFPNALYIITDLIHLEMDTDVPKWFDAILLFSASAAGLLMAFVSLFRIENFLAGYAEKKWLSLIMPLILFLGSFGVYLGRFLRWNSWDIISNPLGLLSTVVQRVFFPWEHLRTWGVTGILTVLYYLLYLSVKKLPEYISVRPAQGRQIL